MNLAIGKPGGVNRAKRCASRRCTRYRREANAVGPQQRDWTAPYIARVSRTVGALGARAYLPGACIPCSSASTWRFYERWKRVRPDAVKCLEAPPLLRHLKKLATPPPGKIGNKAGSDSRVSDAGVRFCCGAEKGTFKGQQSWERLYLISRQLSHCCPNSLQCRFPLTPGVRAAPPQKQIKSRTGQDMKHCPSTVSIVDSPDAGRVALACHC